MRRTITAVAAAAALTLAVANPAAAKGPKPVEGSIVDTAVALSGTPFEFDENGGDFDILVAAVVALGFDGLLDSQRNFTVFAPTDQAFLDLASALTESEVTDEAEAFGIVAGVEGVADILAYHVAPGERFSGDVVSSTQVNTLLKGYKIPIGGETLIGNANPVAPELLDVEVANGVIHVIDAVLLPGMS